MYSVRYCTESDGAVTDMIGVAALTICLLLLVTQFAISTIPVLINALLKPQKVRIPTGQETFLISKLTPGSVADDPSCSSMVTRIFRGEVKGLKLATVFPSFESETDWNYTSNTPKYIHGIYEKTVFLFNFNVLLYKYTYLSIYLLHRTESFQRS